MSSILSNSEAVKTTYCKMFSKEPGTDDANAFFGVSEKVDGSWKTTSRFNTLEGYLVGIEVGSFEYKGDEKKVLKITFRDEFGEKVQAESTFTLLAYGIINTLANVDPNKKVKIKLYTRNRKDNGERIAASYIEQEGERVSWMYEPSEIPKIKKVMVGKKEVIDDEHVIDFYMDIIDRISEKIKNSNPSASELFDRKIDLSPSEQLEETARPKRSKPVSKKEQEIGQVVLQKIDNSTLKPNESFEDSAETDDLLF